MTWTDLHSHILPGFDDGASSDEEFLEMARVAVKGGTSLMAATPHYDSESPAFDAGEAAAAPCPSRTQQLPGGAPLHDPGPGRAGH